MGFSDNIDNRGSERSLQRAWLAAVLVALCAAALLFVAGCSCSASNAGGGDEPAVIDTLETTVIPETDARDSQSAEIPVDFAALQEQNSDVYAWIYIPDTAVNLPVLQNSFLDNYYLIHDAFGDSSDMGALYTQSVNERDFKDPVTVIYGHTFESDGVVGDAMFGTLHYFEDAQFFEEHPNFYIYTPSSILTYEVVSAYEYDNRHILNSFDFSDPEVAQAYFDYVANPDSMVKNIRSHDKLEAGTNHIVQLSTCTHPPNDSARYLVTGVLVDERSV